MMDFKEMRIRKARHGNMPLLSLNGAWLTHIGFTAGTLVNVVYQDACLILSILATPNISSVIPVTSKLVRGKERAFLTLDGFLLKRYGFNVGDQVVLQLMQNTIQITKINFYTTTRYA